MTRSASSSSLRSLVLPRGINVGGRHAVAMAALRALFEELGCRDVATYIQSGNLVATVPAALSADSLAAVIEQRFGFAVPVSIRTALEVTMLVDTNPFVAAGHSVEALHCVFLSEPLPEAQRARLDAMRTGEEALAAVGRELFLSLPAGFGRSKLAMACTGPKLPGNPTIRNWKTVLALQAMLRS